MNHIEQLLNYWPKMNTLGWMDGEQQTQLRTDEHYRLIMDLDGYIDPEVDA